MEIRIPLSRPDISELERRAVDEVLRTPFLSMGPRTRAFEDAFRKWTGRPHALAVSSGTAGLHLALLTLEIGPGDAVITTPFSFVASTNVILHVGAEPLFFDIDPESLNLDVEAVESYLSSYARREGDHLVDPATGLRIRAILTVDVFGHPVPAERWRELADRWGLYWISDSCEAVGSRVRVNSGWEAAGAKADIAVYAFYPNKQITTGEGGMVVTDREDWARTLRALHNQGRLRGGRWLMHDLLGYNYRMDELSAALGEAQMRRLEEMRQRRRAVFQRYDQALQQLPSIQRPRAASWADVHWFVYVVRVPAALRNEVMDALQRAGIESRPYFDPPIHLQPVHRERFARYAGQLPITERVSQEVVALPFYNHLTGDMQEEVVAVLREVLNP